MIRWAFYQPGNGEKPHQYFLDGAPCDMVAIGFRDGERLPSVQRLRTADGILHLVWSDEDGVFPGVEIEIEEVSIHQ